MKNLGQVVILLAVLGLIGSGLFLFPGSPVYFKSIGIHDDSAKALEQKNSPEGAPDTEEAMSQETSASSTETDATQPAIEEPQETYTLTEKILGSPDAPVTITEFSSLSCGHCGAFHKDVYPKIKDELVNTGKVKLKIIDFPLNMPALQGAMLAHCLPDEQYFNFLQLLFSTQEIWLSGDYLAKLKQNAQLAGLSSEEIETCLNNKALEEALIARMQDAQTQYGVESTPSFVFNNGPEKITGNAPYENFLSKIALVEMAPQKEDAAPAMNEE